MPRDMVHVLIRYRRGSGWCAERGRARGLGNRVDANMHRGEAYII